MSTNTKKDDSLKNEVTGEQLSFEQISALSKNLFDRLMILEEGSFRKLDPTKDTRSIYFEKSKIDALFAANPGSDGLRIYLGIHDSSHFKLRQPGYHNKLMVALVSTTGGVENLDKPGTNRITYGGGNGGGGTGTDNGKLCPPDTDC
jgi:hypothetical protein